MQLVIFQGYFLSSLAAPKTLQLCSFPPLPQHRSRTHHTTTTTITSPENQLHTQVSSITPEPQLLPLHIRTATPMRQRDPSPLHPELPPILASRVPLRTCYLRPSWAVLTLACLNDGSSRPRRCSCHTTDFAWWAPPCCDCSHRRS